MPAIVGQAANNHLIVGFDSTLYEAEDWLEDPLKSKAPPLYRNYTKYNMVVQLGAPSGSNFPSLPCANRVVVGLCVLIFHLNLCRTHPRAVQLG